jgi:protein phosphatase
LYLFRYEPGNDSAKWSEVKTVGTKPAPRYGHTLTFSSPYVIMFGGITGQETVNDSWCLNIDKEPYQWSKLTCQGPNPGARVYHSAAHCQSGAATGMIVIFGGRSGDRQDALNDAWGLRKHRDGRWDWVQAPYHHNGIRPKARYQHSGLFLGSLMFIIGGRASDMPDNLRLDIFDTETSEWHSIPNIQRFRHVAWLFQGSIFIQGGFEQENPSLPVSDVHKIDLMKGLAGKPALINKIKTFLQSSNSPINSYSNTPNLTPDMSPVRSTGNNNNNP